MSGVARLERVAAKKRSRTVLRNAARRAAVVLQEERDEKLAPAAQRGRRLVRDGVSFRVGSPLVLLFKAGQRREKGGGEATINVGHVRAADRLQRAWEECRTVSFGCSGYGQSVGGGDVGVISAAVLASVGRQHAAAKEVAGVFGVLGPLRSVVEAVALEGVSLSGWAASRKDEEGRPAPMQQLAAYGYLRAGMDLVIDYYRRLG